VRRINNLEHLIKRIREIRTEVDDISAIVEKQSFPVEYNRRVFLFSEIDTLIATLRLLENRFYKESFIIIRTVLEKFLYFWLMLEGRKYRWPVNYRVQPKTSLTVKEARDNTLDLWQREKKSGNQNFDEIINIQRGSRNDEFIVTYESEGLYAKGDVNKSGESIPNYNFILEEYRPDDAHISDIRTVDEGLVSPETISQVINMQKGIYHNYFYIGNILRNLKMCNLIDDIQQSMIRVHYNFLSKYVHPTIEDIEMRKITNEEGHDSLSKIETFEELILLYVAKFLCLYIKAFTMKYKSKSNAEACTKYEKIVGELNNMSGQILISKVGKRTGMCSSH
jgi:hypothetical protein